MVVLEQRTDTRAQAQWANVLNRSLRFRLAFVPAPFIQLRHSFDSSSQREPSPERGRDPATRPALRCILTKAFIIDKDKPMSTILSFELEDDR